MAGLKMERPELQEVWKADDDWTEITAKEERKKRQNRLNQRAYRRRLAEQDSSSKRTPFRVDRFRISEVPPTAAKEKKTSTVSGPAPSKSLRKFRIPGSDDSCSNDAPLSTPQHLQIASSGPQESLTDHQGAGVVSSHHDNFVATLDSQLKLSHFVPEDVTSHSPDRCQLVNLIQPTPLTNDFTSCPAQAKGPLSVNFNSHCPFELPEEEVPEMSEPIRNNFPLSADHLLNLIHQNVFRALISNKSLLSITSSLIKVELNFELPVTQNFCDGVSVIRPRSHKALPPSLLPTQVQMNVAHSSWMNMFPFPRFRDNLIKHERNFDHGELCCDLFGDLLVNNAKPKLESSLEDLYSTVDIQSLCSEVEADTHDPWEELDDSLTYRRHGLIVWGESWDHESWEITPGFARKWPWVLEGCEELIASSNKWRARRCEDPLALPVSRVPPVNGCVRGDFLYMDQAAFPEKLRNV